MSQLLFRRNSPRKSNTRRSDGSGGPTGRSTNETETSSLSSSSSSSLLLDYLHQLEREEWARSQVNLWLLLRIPTFGNDNDSGNDGRGHCNHPTTRRRRYDTNNVDQMLQASFSDLRDSLHIFGRHNNNSDNNHSTASLQGILPAGAAGDKAPPPASLKAIATLPRARMFPAPAAATKTEHDQQHQAKFDQAEEAVVVSVEECSICCKPLRTGAVVTRLPCGHLHHQDCIQPWLVRHCTCPDCRYELETADAAYEPGRIERMENRRRRHCWTLTDAGSCATTNLTTTAAAGCTCSRKDQAQHQQQKQQQQQHRPFHDEGCLLFVWPHNHETIGTNNGSGRSIIQEVEEHTTQGLEGMTSTSSLDSSSASSTASSPCVALAPEDDDDDPEVLT